MIYIYSGATVCVIMTHFIFCINGKIMVKNTYVQVLGYMGNQLLTYSSINVDLKPDYLFFYAKKIAKKAECHFKVNC